MKSLCTWLEYDHPFKYTEQYKALIIRVLQSEVQNHQAAIQDAMCRVQQARSTGDPSNVEKQ